MENGELVSRTEARAIMMAEGGAGDALMAFSISCSFNGEPETTVILVVGVREDGFLINAVTVWLCEMAVESISLPVLPEAPRRRILGIGAFWGGGSAGCAFCLLRGSGGR